MTERRDDEDPVLVFAPIGRDAAASAEVIGRANIPVRVCIDQEDLVERLKRGASAAFIAEEGLLGHDVVPLAEWVRSQPPWSDLPFILLTSSHGGRAAADWRGRLLGELRNVSILERPVQTITLTSTVRAALRARSRQYEVRDLLDARERAAQELEALVDKRTAALAEANAELRRQIAERAKIEESLRQAQKLEAVGRLTGGVAHDFNNLLMVIAGGISLLNRNGDPARRANVIEGMNQAVQRGAGLTRQLLAFSRRQELKPKSVDIRRQIGGMRELLDRSLREDVNVNFEFSEDLWPVWVDPGELELAILNLAVNARDAMPHGGAITITAANCSSATDYGLQGDFVTLKVADTGVGMPSEVQSRVFEPFFTTKDVGKGSGLGLAQVHGFVTQSGGAITIDSAPGEGTTITLYLPRSLALAASDETALIDLNVQRAPKHDAGRVLFVEDDDEVAELVGKMLEELGYQVTRAASASAALGALANGRQLDIVFSDIMMPGGMNGVELAKEIRSRRPGLPILLTSGYSEAAQEAATGAGARILPKPYALEELAAALRDARKD